MTLDEAIRTSELAGYKQRAPSATCAAEDAAMVAAWDCAFCGHHGLEYQPFSKPGSYRAFALCAECCESSEF